MLLLILVSITLYSAFSIRPIRATGTIYISADGSISPSEAPVSSLDNVTYSLTANMDYSIVVERSSILIDGASYTVQGDGTENGFSLLEVTNVTIRNARIKSCFHGIQLFNSSNNIVTGNSIIGSSYEGVGVYYSSGNVITSNSMTDNQIGIAFYDSSNNLIVNNSFVSNTRQAYAESSLNYWDNGSKGNYWSDYEGTDLNQDGIGDASYIIDVNSQDRYPLMKPSINARPATDLNGDGKVNIVDMALVAQAFGSSSGQPRWNPICDIDHNGQVNIIDLTMVAKDFGKTV
jgi:parallel beta-helix repeat protein